MFLKYTIFFLLHLSQALAQTTTTPSSTRRSFNESTTTARPGCPTRCGDMTIPYPFGIGINCSIGHWYEVSCDESSGRHIPYIATANGSYEVLEILDDYLRIRNQVLTQCYNQSGYVTEEDMVQMSFNLSGSPYTLSDVNRLTTVGCDNVVLVISGSDESSGSGCVTVCGNSSHIDYGDCSGIGCCQIPIPRGLQFLETGLSSISNHSDILDSNPCGYAFIGDPMSYRFSKRDFKDETFPNRTSRDVPIVFDWAIGNNRTCDEVKQYPDYACMENSVCISGFGGYRCNCSEGYEGNPYLSPGCTDINECENNPCAENGVCLNSPGSYRCFCKHGYKGDGRKNSVGCISDSSELRIIHLSIGLGVGLLLLFAIIIWVYFGIKKRKLAKMREKFFVQNGGLLLSQDSLNAGGSRSTKVFSSKELEKATNYYAEDRIIGRGGHGIVYKGTLPDQRVVAIKKSRVMDQSQMEQFINEVIILTQVNHRNVVKLLGCCLESEVPILVYEYISHGTLYEHIHNSNGESSWISWKDRLRIAVESANALAYLYSSASMPVIHRDVKSSNILLDDSYTAKISDFGASRLISLDQTQITTLVQGTLGYLDPEYFQTSQLTGKSDVYSFGVILAELMTGRKPLSPMKSEEERNLTTYFISALKKNELFRILEPGILREGSLEQFQAIGELVRRCLNLKGDERPTMKEVAVELEGVLKKHPCIQQ